MNFIDLMGDFGGLVIVAIFVMLLVITIACILASSIFEEIHDWILNDDAKHLVQNRLPKLKGWKPQGDNLKKFIEKELGGKGFVRGTKQHYDGQTLQEFLCLIIAFCQDDSSLVVAQATQRGELCTVIYMRFWWKGRWWALWYGPKKPGRSPQFRAFPETWLEAEIWPEVGRVTEFHTIPYETISHYYF